jgi:hypothetical protein
MADENVNTTFGWIDMSKRRALWQRIAQYANDELLKWFH